MFRSSDLEKGLAAALIATSGCGAGNMAESVRPTDPTANHAMDEKSCPVPEDSNSPLVVDWREDQRDELEIAMRDGVAVVSYDCNELRLLPKCTVSGNYEFKPTTNQKRFIRLRNLDEIRASLPTSGERLGLNLEAGIKRGATLDITLQTVGRLVTSRGDVSRALLRGECEGATHIVRAATIGAFSMNTNTLGEVGAGANISEAGVSTDGSSEKTVGVSSGNLEECAKTVSDEKPPVQCGTPLRLHLETIEGDETGNERVSESGSGKGNGTSNEGLYIRPEFSYMQILASDQTNVHLVSFGAGIGYTVPSFPFTLGLSAGGLNSPGGGIASHYSRLAEGADRWTEYVQAGIGFRPKLTSWFGMSAMGNGMVTFDGGGAFLPAVGPEFYLGKRVAIGLNVVGGYVDLGKALGSNPTIDTPDPRAHGFSLGADLTGTVRLF